MKWHQAGNGWKAKGIGGGRSASERKLSGDQSVKALLCQEKSREEEECVEKII